MSTFVTVPETSPQGSLYVTAQKKAKSKTNGHEEKAECGCSVTVRWFSSCSHTVRFHPCPAHAPKRDPKTGRTTS